MMTKIIDIMWLMIICIGIGVGRYVGEISTGEFYIALMIWYCVARFLAGNWDDWDDWN